MKLPIENASLTSGSNAAATELVLAHAASGTALLDGCLAALLEQDPRAWQAAQRLIVTGARMSVRLDAWARSGFRCSIEIAHDGVDGFELCSFDMPAMQPSSH